MAVTKADAMLVTVYRAEKHRLVRASAEEERNWWDMACFSSLSLLQKSPITALMKRSIKKNITSATASGSARSTEAYIE